MGPSPDPPLQSGKGVTPRKIRIGRHDLGASGANGPPLRRNRMFRGACGLEASRRIGVIRPDARTPTRIVVPQSVATQGDR